LVEEALMTPKLV